MREAVRVDEVLVDAHGVAPELDLRFDPRAVRLARRRPPPSAPQQFPVAGVGEFDLPGPPSRWPPRGNLNPAHACSGGSSCDPRPCVARSRADSCRSRAAFRLSCVNAASRRSLLPRPSVSRGAVYVPPCSAYAKAPLYDPIEWGILSWPQVGEFGWPPGRVRWTVIG